MRWEKDEGDEGVNIGEGVDGTFGGKDARRVDRKWYVCFLSAYSVWIGYFCMSIFVIPVIILSHLKRF